MKILNEGDVFMLPIGTSIGSRTFATGEVLKDLTITQDTWYIVTNVTSALGGNKITASELWSGEYNDKAPVVAFYQGSKFSIHKHLGKINIVGNRKRVTTFVRH